MCVSLTVVGAAPDELLVLYLPLWPFCSGVFSRLASGGLCGCFLCQAVVYFAHRLVDGGGTPQSQEAPGGHAPLSVSEKNSLYSSLIF